MMELLDDLTEIPFEIFWDKYQELSPNPFYNWDKARIQWFRMKEQDRVRAFTCLPKFRPTDEPYQYLEHHQLPF